MCKRVSDVVSRIASLAVCCHNFFYLNKAELLDSVALNLHRIDKDVQRCDRHYWYFGDDGNLIKLRNIMCT